MMNNERFSVPEIIFRPDMIGLLVLFCKDEPLNISLLGLDQSGLAGTVLASISSLPEDLQGMFWANVGLIGGNTKLPGFRERLYERLVERLKFT
jgi:actin-related protein 6